MNFRAADGVGQVMAIPAPLCYSCRPSLVTAFHRMAPLSSTRLRATPGPAQKISARVIPLPPPRKKFARWRLAAAAAVLLLGAAAGAAAWWLRGSPAEMDAEDSTFAEVIQPAPADVIAPPPVLPALAMDKSAAALAIPASALQLPDPPPAGAAPDGIPIAAPGDALLANVAGHIEGQAAPSSGAGNKGVSITMHDDEASSPGRMLADARAALEAGDDHAALLLYDRVLAQDPASRLALQGKAFGLQREGQYAGAADALRRLLRLDPKNEKVRADLAAALGAAASPQAVKELESMTAAHPGVPALEAALARALAGSGDNTGALAHAQRAAGAEPAAPLYRLDLAILHDRLGHTAEAAAAYRQVLKILRERGDDAAPLPLSAIAIARRADYLEAQVALVRQMASPEEK